MAFIDRIVDTIPNISVITKIELLGYEHISLQGQSIVHNFVLDAMLLELVSEVVAETINLRKAYKIELPDAIIAATALCYQLKLVTRNISDFKRIKGLVVVNPHTL